MNARTTALILFVWALLTVITPTLVRMSASAKLMDGFQARGMKSRLPRRALIGTRFIESPEPEPKPEPEPEPAPAPAPAPGLFWRSKYGLCSVCCCPEANGRPCVCCLQ